MGDIKDLTLLEIEEDQNGLFNIFVPTFTDSGLNLEITFAQRRHAMRLHLIAQEFMGSDEYVGFLCKINDYQNPFAVREGDLILYTSGDEAEKSIRTPVDEIARNRQAIQREIKKAKIDPSRINYLNNRRKGAGKGTSNNPFDPLPPTVSTDDTPQVVVDNNKIKLSPNRFNNPNKNIEDQPTDAEDIEDSQVGQEPTEQFNNIDTGEEDEEDTTRRVLVDKFIRRK